MSQLAPDDRPLYSRLHELGPLADVILEIEPDELWFFRLDENARPAAAGDPSVLLIRESSEGQNKRVASLLRRAGDPGPVRLFWLTPDELERPVNAAFMEEIESYGEALMGPSAPNQGD